MRGTAGPGTGLVSDPKRSAVLEVWAGGLLTFDRLHRQRERSGLPLEIRRLDQAAQMCRLFAGLSVLIGFAIPWSVT
jgi:hypothetical protein